MEKVTLILTMIPTFLLLAAIEMRDREKQRRSKSNYRNYKQTRKP